MPDLFLHNSLSRSKEEFQPLEAGKVSIYTCGPTVYDSSHIGHARSVIAWDILVRYLRFLNYTVVWARNITDIDDKIINRSLEKGIEPQKLARMETFKFWQDMNSLNIVWPDLEPRATETLAEMFEFIQGLIAKDAAYQSANGDVYFRVASFANYGQLKNLAELKDNVSRVEHLDCKESNCDFALWKAFPKEQHGYASPFGHGRPGWHLECSAMIKKYFGQSIDIHGGGEDLIFPHHENEIAQSECLHDGSKFAKYWVHNAMILVNGKKMSKSEGNYITIKEALQESSGNAIRFFVLMAHYRQPINYTQEALQSANQGYLRLVSCLQSLDSTKLEPEEADKKYLQQFREAMNDDLNTASAMAVLFEISKEINKGNTKLKTTLAYLMQILGFDLSAKTSTGPDLESLQPLFETLIDMRNEAKAAKDFAKADLIRTQFEKAGFILQDSSQGTKVQVK